RTSFRNQLQHFTQPRRQALIRPDVARRLELSVPCDRLANHVFGGFMAVALAQFLHAAKRLLRQPDRSAVSGVPFFRCRTFHNSTGRAGGATSDRSSRLAKLEMGIEQMRTWGGDT